MNSEIKNTAPDFKGIISVSLANEHTLDNFCREHIAEYNGDRFEAFAIRIMAGDETIVTVYAYDKVREGDSNLKEGKFAVKKFKLTDVPLSSLISYCSAFSCTLSNGNYNIEDMEVMNK
jgi:hypothetical protein